MISFPLSLVGSDGIAFSAFSPQRVRYLVPRPYTHKTGGVTVLLLTH